MAGPLKREVLQAFKNLHRARMTVFKGDERVLKDARERINQEFKKNKTVESDNSLHDMIQYANAVAFELRTTVVQAEEKAPGLYKLHIRPETQKLDNMPFNPDVEIPRRRGKKKGDMPCCQESNPCCQEVTAASQAKSNTSK